jgi:predicted short-subunit dehydrogenase-like oxidoreductase (DUF2520 family)
MKKALSLALVGAGPLSRSGVSRLPGLKEHLTFVKAASVRVASRIVNNFRAGAPARYYTDLAECRAFLIAVPTSRMPGVFRELAESGIDWHHRIVGAWHVPFTSTEMSPLVEAGARTATLHPLVEAEPWRMAIEGHKEAIRNFRLILEDRDTRLMEVRSEDKALFCAGLTFATSLYTPLIHCTYESLRASGLDNVDAAAVAEIMLVRTLRSYMKGGVKGWTGPLAARDFDSISRQAAALALRRPAMARYHAAAIRGACEIMGRDTKWLRDVLERSGTEPRAQGRVPAVP